MYQFTVKFEKIKNLVVKYRKIIFFAGDVGFFCQIFYEVHAYVPGKMCLCAYNIFEDITVLLYYPVDMSLTGGTAEVRASVAQSFRLA